jgi:hypothetical protein
MSSAIFDQFGVKQTRLFMGGTAYSVAALAGALAGCSAVSSEAPGTDEASVQAKQQALQEAPPLPSPLAFARGLDLECYRSEGQPPVNELKIRQLNPVLKGVLPNQKIRVEEMLETCLPVSKNQVTPPADVLRFIRWVDLACYRADADPVDVTVNLKHLNPVLQDLPDENVRLKQLRRFCSPVRKNFSDIEAPVRRLVEHLDFACYEFEELTPSANRNLTLSHLNPVVKEFGFSDRLVQLKRANQLCVPVGKNQQQIPHDVQHVVEWVDFAAYHTEPLAFPAPDFPLLLTQLNPLFAGAAPTQTFLRDPRRLLVPVAKNQLLPPIE